MILTFCHIIGIAVICAEAVISPNGTFNPNIFAISKDVSVTLATGTENVVLQFQAAESDILLTTLTVEQIKIITNSSSLPW